MGLRDVVSKAIDVAFVATGDIPVAATLKHYSGTAIRDPDTGVTTKPSSTLPCTVILIEPSDSEGRANVLEYDRQALMKAKDVPAVEVGDILTITSSGDTYEVLKNLPDPTEQMWQLYLRRAKPKVA